MLPSCRSVTYKKICESHIKVTFHPATYFVPVQSGDMDHPVPKATGSCLKAHRLGIKPTTNVTRENSTYLE
jgi:hypothetical protein